MVRRALTRPNRLDMAFPNVRWLEQPSVSSQVAPALRFDNVSVSFDDRPALARVSFELPAGETRVVFGAGGSGKTVLMKAAIGLIRPESGHVYLFGRDITTLTEEELDSWRPHAGVLFQEGGLFDSLTVAENVAFPLVNQRDRKPSESEVESRVREALAFVGLAHVMEKYPSELSGGMRRRVGIARAAVTRPPLLLYDSPTAGLDPITAYHIMVLLIRQRDTRNEAAMVVTYRRQDGHLMANFMYDPSTGKLQRSDNVRRGTKFLVLRQGRVVFEGSQSELQASTDPYVSKFAKKPESVQTRS